MTRRLIQPNRPARQRGAVLLVALVLLSMMLVLGVSAMDSTIVQERLTANTRDRMTAFESNETASRNAFDFLRKLIADGRSLPDNSAGWYNSGMLPDSGGNIVAADSASLSFWQSTPLNSTNSQLSSLAATANVDAQGRFLIEHLRFDDESEPGSATVYSVNFNSATVNGQGLNGGSVSTQATLMTLPR